MVHDASTFAFGDADEMRTAADFIDKVSGVMAGLYATKTGKPVEEIRALMSPKDTWLTADEALSLGLIDGLDESRSVADAEVAKAKALALVGGQVAANMTEAASGSLVLTGFTPAGQTIDAFDIYASGELTITTDSTPAEAALARASQTPSAEPVAQQHPTPTLEVTVADDAANTPVVPGSDESPPTITAPVAAATGPDHLAEITRLSTQVAEMQAREATREKAEFFATAASQGRYTPAEQTELEAMYDKAPEETKAFILARAVGSMVPVAPVGHEGDGVAMTEYELLYGKEN
jgi:hypothetical protein